MEDLVAFNLHYFDKSNAVKKVIRNSNMFCSAVITVPMTFLGYSAGHTIIFFILGAMISYLFIFFTPIFMRRNVIKLARNTFLESNDKSVVCEHQLEITGDGITETTNVNSNSHMFKGILKIENEADYTYIYIGPSMAHVIPHKKILEGDFLAFINFLQNKLK